MTVRRVQHATAGQNGDETLRTRSIISCWNLKVFSSKWSFNNNKKKTKPTKSNSTKPVPPVDNIQTNISQLTYYVHTFSKLK